MAKEKNGQASMGDSNQKKNKKGRPKTETLFGVFSVIFLLGGTLSLFSAFKLGGTFGNSLFLESMHLLGAGSYLVPVLLFAASFYTWRESLPAISFYETTAGILSIISLFGLGGAVDNQTISGSLGKSIFETSEKLFGTYPSILIFLGILGASLFIVFDTKPDLEKWKLWFLSLKEKLRLFFIKDESRQETFFEEELDEVVDLKEVVEEINDESEKETLRESMFQASTKKKLDIENQKKREKISELKEPRKRQNISELSFERPPLSLLENDKGRPNVGDIKEKAAIIRRTLQNFGITVEMDEISIGPSVTRYALKPAQGVKLSKIVGLQNELALDLAVESIRVEAPIPGKSLVGIEIPNESKSIVGLGTLLSDEKFTHNPNPLLLALGRGISGKAQFSNLAKMPHLLIAGTTGSGKSVVVHTIIQSLLFRNSPYDLKFIMVDPKKVELTFYNSIPHLYTPVITSAKKTIQTLAWAINEMDRRYDVLEENKEKDIKAYHEEIFFPALEKARKAKNAEAELPERMPYIVIIIDELADIMMSYPKELESAIVRLAQKSRAVGIHLILSTQRPEVKVITGLIKANIPSRVALKVASQIDSRTIIDMAGSEKLLGQGDMLFMSPDNPKPERLQSAFVSTEEIKRVVKYLQQKYATMVPEEIIVSDSMATQSSLSLFASDVGVGSGSEAPDDLYETAKEIVVSSGKASTSYLQRRLKIGYSRAARLIDILEEKGVVSAAHGAKARSVVGREVSGFGTEEPVEEEVGVKTRETQ